jgi:integrase
LSVSLKYSVKFDSNHGYYRARFWESGYTDAYAKVPDAFWISLGHTPPRIEPADERKRTLYLKLALEWASKERDNRTQIARDQVRGVASKKTSIRQTFALYQAEGRAKMDPETRAHDDKLFAAIARHVDVDALTPESIDEPLLTTYANARKGDKVRNRDGQGNVVLLDKIVRHRTVNNEIGLLQRLARFAWRWRSRTGCDGVRLPEDLRGILLPGQDSTQVALSEAQLGELLAIAPPLKRRLIIFGVTSALREENLFGMRGEWIGWNDAWLKIPAEFMKKGRSEQARELSRPLPAIAMQQLGDPRLSGYIWPNPTTGLPFTRLGLDVLCAAAGVPAISEHDLRTTGNTLLHTNGVDHLTRKALMGHSIKTGDVTDLYTKVMREAMLEAVKVFDRIFARVLNPAIKVVQIADHR